MPRAVQPSFPQSGRSPLAATKPAQAVETTKALRRACRWHGVLLCSPVSSMAGSGLHADCKQYCTQQLRMLRHFWGCLMRTFDSCLYTRAASRRRWVSGCAEAAGLAADAAEADATSPNPLRALLKKLGRGLGAVPALMEWRRVLESCCSEPWRSIDPAPSHQSCAAQVVSGAPLLRCCCLC